MKNLFALSFLLLAVAARADDLGFRYDADHNRCVNANGEEGYNPDVVGECGEILNKDLSRQTLSRLNLRGIHFKDSTLDYVDFTHSDLTGMKAENCSFRNADLSDIDIDRAQFKGSDFRSSDLNRSRLNGAGFATSRLDRTDLQDAYLVGAQFAASSLNDAWTCGADFYSVQQYRTTWRGAEYDNSTRLPFSEDEAKKQGMVYGNCR